VNTREQHDGGDGTEERTASVFLRIPWITPDTQKAYGCIRAKQCNPPFNQLVERANNGKVFSLQRRSGIAAFLAVSLAHVA
jgi:hypothetical protein